MLSKHIPPNPPITAFPIPRSLFQIMRKYYDIPFAFPHTPKCVREGGRADQFCLAAISGIVDDYLHVVILIRSDILIRRDP